MPLLSHIGFVIFLIIYSVFKYRAVPELMGQSTYIISTLVLVILTAVIPYIVSVFAVSKVASKAKLAIASILPLILCAIGLAIYFFVFIAPNAPGMSVTQVLPRSIVPGLVMGGILLLRTITHNRSAA